MKSSRCEFQVDLVSSNSSPILQFLCEEQMSGAKARMRRKRLREQPGSLTAGTDWNNPRQKYGVTALGGSFANHRFDTKRLLLTAELHGTSFSDQVQEKRGITKC